jgi:hypothetical protein
MEIGIYTGNISTSHEDQCIIAVDQDVVWDVIGDPGGY